MRIAQKAFSIVELAVVIAVIGILATITTVGYTKLQKDARDTERASDIAVMQSALETFYEKKGFYPQMSFFYFGVSEHDGKKFTELVNVPAAAMTDPADINPSPPLYSYPSQAAWSANPGIAASWPTSNEHRYVYLPYTETSALCQMQPSGCTKYSLYYTSEQEGRREVRSRYGW